MASGLHKLQSNVLKKLLPGLKHSILNNKSSNFGSECRTMMTISVNAGFPVNDAYAVQGKENLKSKTSLTLKEKEKGDWRKLSLAEKQELYRMSFSQPFSEAIENPEEWKLILAGAFTAMGLMTLGIYVWLSRTILNRAYDGPLQFQNELSLKNHVNDLLFPLKIDADRDYNK